LEVAFGSKATRSPATHVECFVHEACPSAGWKVPAGHAPQFSAFVVAEKVPFAHGAQLRSTVALGCCITRSPFAQAACGRQNPFPTSFWNELVAHDLHATAFSISEKCPAAHPVHALPLT
jgi:hypothetical protein